MDQKIKIISIFFDSCITFLLFKKKDKRGFFSRLYDLNVLNKAIPKKFKILQIYHSYNKKKGIFRGFHFQIHPYTQDKYVCCTRGKILDMVIDLRKESKTYLKIHKEILSEKNCKAIYIPKGFAHGFLTLENNSEVIYLTSQYYNKLYERGIRYNDKLLKYRIPNLIKIISKRDMNFPNFKK